MGLSSDELEAWQVWPCVSQALSQPGRGLLRPWMLSPVPRSPSHSEARTPNQGGAQGQGMGWGHPRAGLWACSPGGPPGGSQRWRVPVGNQGQVPGGSREAEPRKAERRPGATTASGPNSALAVTLQPGPGSDLVSAAPGCPGSLEACRGPDVGVLGVGLGLFGRSDFFQAASSRRPDPEEPSGH